MKRSFIAIATLLVANFVSAQYLIIGNDSISLKEFKKDYEYGLKTNGIEKTIQSTEDFILLQQFAKSKNVDTTAAFQQKYLQKEAELKNKYFFPKAISQAALKDYVLSNKTERKVQVFALEKEAGDTNDYQKIYAEVKSGKLSMEDAIKKYTKVNSAPFFVKAGVLDNRLESQIKTLPNNTYTTLINTKNYVAFAKVIDTRPSLGYIVFATLSYPNDDKAQETAKKIEKELAEGKEFQEISKTYGTTEHEKKNGGLVMGSPTLPDEIYNAVKGQKEGFTSKPILNDNKYYVFHIYQIIPYDLNDKTEDFFFKELRNSQYGEKLQNAMLGYIKSQPGFKEFPAFKQVQKSFQSYEGLSKNPSEVLFQFNGIKTTIGDLNSILETKREDALKLTPEEWSEAVNGLQEQKLLEAYSQDLSKQSPIKEELLQTEKTLYSDYIFTKFLKEEIASHPEWISEHYEKNKSKFMWGNRAKGRVAIIADPKLVSDIKSEIKNEKNWEFLKARYKGKLNDKGQVLVYFQEGEMAEDADVFTKYKVPFKKGIHNTSMQERDLVIAIDDILAPSQMTKDEAKDLVSEALSEELLNKIISEQRAKTKIVVQPEFIKDLEKNFKK